MQTISFQAPEEMNKKLDLYAREMDRSKAYLIRQALGEYLEDLADYLEARKVQAETKPEDYISFEEVQRRLGLNDD